MTQTPDIEAVLFDADGVLQMPIDGWRKRLTDMCGAAPDNRDHAPDNNHREAFLQDLYAAEMPALRGEGDFADLLTDVLRKWNSPFTSQEAVHNHTTIVQANPDALAVVCALRAAGVGAFVASNQHEYRARHMSAHMGYAAVFDGEFYSCRLGYKKPDIGYFRAVLEALPIPAERLLFIDDREPNVAAACEIGIHGVVFHPDGGAPALRQILVEHGIEALNESGE